MAKKVTKKSPTVRPAKKLDLTKPLKVAASGTPRTKSASIEEIAQHVGVHRRDVAGVFHVLSAMIRADLSKSGSGVFTIPALMRITVKRKPATKARQGINPFTKEPMTIKAKPARNVVRVRPLQALKQTLNAVTAVIVGGQPIVRGAALQLLAWLMPWLQQLSFCGASSFLLFFSLFQWQFAGRFSALVLAQLL